MPEPLSPTSAYPPAEAHERGAELVTADGKVLPLVAATLRAEASGGIARVVLEQTFRNPHAEVLRVVYRMPLPADGAVSGYEFSIGARTIKGRVEPKAAAREQFEQAIADGRTAALLEQDRADIFTQEIGNLPPGATIVARITVDQRLAWLSEGEWELRFPTVIGPRYLGSVDTVADARAVAVDIAQKDVIGARIKLELVVRDEITKGRTVESPSHRVTSTGDGTWMLSALDGARLDRDLVLRWAVAQPEVGLSLAIARPEAKLPHAHQAYGLLTLVPPAPDASFAVVPRDLIVLLDTSGSMSGPPLEQAKRVVSLLVDSLGERDRLELIEFSSAPAAWEKAPVAATESNKKRALRWLTSLQAGGSTEMYTAIVEGLRALRPGAQRQVVLVTDGYIGGEQQIVDLLHERLPDRCRLHVVGVGSAVNRSLAVSLARAGRGTEIMIGLAGEAAGEPGDDVERGARRLLERTARPVLTDVTVTGDALVELAPEHVPDVFAGAPIVCAAKLAPEGGELVVRGTLGGGGSWERKLRLPAIAAGEGNHAVVSLFGREHVADLEMRWTIGKEAAAIDRRIERVGTVFQIATRLTSWVAVDEVRSVDPRSGSRLAIQPQELPHGTSFQSFGLAAADAGELAVEAMAPMAEFAMADMLAEAEPATGSMVTRAGVLKEGGEELLRTLVRDAAPMEERPSARKMEAGPPPPKPAAAPAPAPQGQPLPPPASSMVRSSGAFGAPPPTPGQAGIPLSQPMSAPATAPAAPKSSSRARWIAIVLVAVVLLVLLALLALAWLFFTR